MANLMHKSPVNGLLTLKIIAMYMPSPENPVKDEQFSA
jgi:hypothetical protein